MPRKKKDSTLPDWLTVGARVHYHPIIGEAHDGKVYRVTGFTALNSGVLVAYLNSKAGCVAVEALSLVNPEVA